MVFSLENFVDVAFSLFITLCCCRMLFKEVTAGENKSGAWIKELRSLEVMLRELIERASDSGSRLDRNLLRRKQELDFLLRKADEVTRTINNSGGFSPNSNSEFPNETWVRSNSGNREIGDNAAEELSKLSINTKDHVQLSKQVRRGRSAKPQQQRTLNQQIEKSHSLAAGLPPQFQHLDPVALKVAKRLLASGKEIHVVARKLELPLSEVRLLDKLLRQEHEHHDKTENQKNGSEFVIDTHSIDGKRAEEETSDELQEYYAD